MRIERIEIDGFGRFHDAHWELPTGLTVLVGANEAGKTTLLNALRALLFGFEPTRDGRAWYPALAGGRRGGRLVLRTAAGERWTVERHGERGGTGSLAVRAPNGNQGGQETLDRLLRGADRDLYNNIFAFGLGELQTFASLSADGVRGRIYGAGTGLGGTSALDLERRLRQQMDGIFLPRGSQKPLNQLLARIDELRREVADLSRQPEEHAALHRERTELTAVAERLRTEIHGCREESGRLARLAEALPVAAELAALEAELDAGDTDLDRFPADAVEVLDHLSAELREARARIAEIDEGLAEARSARGAIQVDERLLAHADEIAALAEDRGARLAADARRIDLETAAAAGDAVVAEQLARVGGWSEARLLALDDSIPSVEATRVHERDLTSAHAAARDAAARRRAAAEELAQREREAATAGEADVRKLDERASALRAYEELRMRSAVAAGGSGSPEMIRAVASRPVAIVIAAVVGGLMGAAMGSPFGAALPAAAVGAMIAAVALVVLARGRPGAARPSDDLERERRDLLARLGLAPDATDSEVAALSDSLATARARLALAREGRAAIEARRADLERRTGEAEELARAAAMAEETWRTWLADRGLPADATPEAARQLLAAAGIARRAARDRDEQRARLEELAAADARWAERADAVIGALEMRPAGDSSRRMATVADLGRRLEEVRAARRRSEELDASIARLVTRRASAASAVEEAESALAAHLAALGCDRPDEIRRRATSAATRRGLQGRVRELRASLAGIAGGPDRATVLATDSRAADPARIEALRADCTSELHRLEQAERETLNRIGALDARLRELEAAEELGTRRQELAVVEGQAAAMAREWAVRALALRLLEETRSRYERERQPDVVRAAESHFERITAGRYARIVAPPGEGTVRVETEGGEGRATDELSRGTAEQLYLALRFGLIEEFARHAEPLPVVMDDILVNFDADRAARAAAAIRDLSDRHQVLYFTCHTWAAELLDPTAERTLSLG